MNLLAVETSTERCSVALLLGDDIHVNDVLAGQRHSELLLGMVEELLKPQGVGIRDLDGLAFGAGPGSFTGLRIACGVVQGMAFAAHRNVVGISSLLALAENALEPPDTRGPSSGRHVIAALDARMGEVYLAAFEHNGGESHTAWRTVIEPCVADAKSLPRIEGGGWCAIGSGFEAHGYLANHYKTQLASMLTGRMPGAREIARLAAREFAAGRGIAPELAAPLYIRDKVALTIAERAQQRKLRVPLT